VLNLRRGVACGLLAATSLLPPACLFAQEIPLLQQTQEQTQEADTLPRPVALEPPAPITLERVPGRLEQDIERLNKIHRDVARAADYSEARLELDGILVGVRAILDNFEQVALQDLQSSDIDNFRDSIEREQRRLNARSNSLQRRFLELEADQRDLRRIEAEWVLTRDSLGLDSLEAPAFNSGIERILAAADSATIALDSLLLVLLEAGEEIATTGSRIDSALGQLQVVEATHRKQLLYRDAPPLWRPVAVLGDSRPLFGDVWSYVVSDMRAFSSSLNADRDRLLIHLLLFFLVLAVFLRLRTGSQSWPDTPDLQTARYVLSKPFAAAALTALLATSWIYPHASFFLVDAMLVLSMVPVALLLPPLILESRTGVVFWLLALFLGSRLATFLPPGTLVHRLAILGLGVGATVWALSLVRDPESDQWTWVKDGWRRLMNLGLRVAIGIAGVSVLLNVAGWVNLAELLIQGLIPSAYLAIVVALTATVLTGVTRAIASSGLLGRSRAFRANERAVIRLVTRFIRLGALIIWVWGTLGWFGSDRELFAWFGSAITHEFAIGAIQISIGNVMLFLLILWLANWVGRIVRTVLRDDILAGLSIPPGQADAWSTLAQWAILLIGILFAAASAGIGGGQMAVLAGALGVGIGFGLQNIVNNFVSGFILIFEQPIKVGDKIEISSLSLMGEVRRIGIRSSIIRTFAGADVVVPNSNLIQSEVINWTLSDTKRRVEVLVGVKYGTDPQRVADLLLSVAGENPRVLTWPEPVALFAGFGDSSLDFILRIWSATFEESIRLRSEVNMAVNEALREAGIEIPFPQRDLHFRSVAPGVAAGLAAGDSIPGRPNPASGQAPATPDPREEPGSQG
jgi:small-conductance mechanosensitive channel